MLVELWTKCQTAPDSGQLDPVLVDREMANSEPIKEFRQRLQAMIRRVRTYKCSYLVHFPDPRRQFGDITGDHAKGHMFSLSVATQQDSPLVCPLMRKPLIEEYHSASLSPHTHTRGCRRVTLRPQAGCGNGGSRRTSA